MAGCTDDHGMVEAQPQRRNGGTDLSGTVEDCLKRMHFHFRCAGVRLRTALSLDLPRIATEEEEVAKMVTDLIVQSIKQAESGSAIQVTTFQTDGRDPRLGSLPSDLTDCLQLAVVEVRGISGSEIESPRQCDHAVFQTKNGSICLILPV